MLDQWLRLPKEQLLAPLAHGVGRYVGATTLTLTAFGVGLGAAACLAQGLYGAGLGLWLLNRTMDGLDGTVARATNTQSDWGGYLDIVLDTAIYALIPAALVLADPRPELWAALGALVASFYINAVSWSYLAALLEKRQAGAKARGEMTSVTMPGGLIEGTETVVFFSAFMLLPTLAAPLFWLMAALVFVTIGQRIVWASRALREELR